MTIISQATRADEVLTRQRKIITKRMISRFIELNELEELNF